eukprot:TRINITY_DN4457_c0_g2_i1.p1 TRINITY_DN4457_c0_g2~~TRINITY_DN4457_c0_g2_i1.p1  ORF type:complete len:224 (-),score=10.97 TRINITY_DN4457_c0_g2_i1:358-1029(-)
MNTSHYSDIWCTQTVCNTTCHWRYYGSDCSIDHLGSTSAVVLVVIFQLLVMALLTVITGWSSYALWISIKMNKEIVSVTNAMLGVFLVFGASKLVFSVDFWVWFVYSDSFSQALFWFCSGCSGSGYMLVIALYFDLLIDEFPKDRGFQRTFRISLLSAFLWVLVTVLFIIISDYVPEELIFNGFSAIVIVVLWIFTIYTRYLINKRPFVKASPIFQGVCLAIV